jgi:hypothetical protein
MEIFQNQGIKKGRGARSMAFKFISAQHHIGAD